MTFKWHLPSLRCLVLPGFRESCHSSAQENTAFKSFCKSWQSAGSATPLKTLVSSAYILRVLVLTLPVMWAEEHRNIGKVKVQGPYPEEMWCPEAGVLKVQACDRSLLSKKNLELNSEGGGCCGYDGNAVVCHDWATVLLPDMTEVIDHTLVTLWSHSSLARRRHS